MLFPRRLPHVLSVALAALPSIKATSIPLNSTSVNDGKNGAVASESSICTDIGIDILKVGGNAADAVSSIIPKFVINFQSC